MCDPDRAEAGPYFVPGLPHDNIILIELGQARISYQITTRCCSLPQAEHGCLESQHVARNLTAELEAAGVFESVDCDLAGNAWGVANLLPSRMLNTRGVSFFNAYSAHNTRILFRT